MKARARLAALVVPFALVCSYSGGALGAPPRPGAPTPPGGSSPNVFPDPGGGAVLGGQYLAKMYTEVLGRAPDSSGWNSWYYSYLAGNGCTRSVLKTIGMSFFQSGEYQNLYPTTTTAKVITLYRAILNRDPDHSGFYLYANEVNASGVAYAANEIYDSTEFGNLVPSICSGRSYYWDGSNTEQFPQMTSGHFAGGTADDLQAALNGTPYGGTLYLDEGAVVAANHSVTIPAGVTLTTYGATSRNQYALMGRIIRAAGFPDAVVHVSSNATLSRIWVDGNRPIGSYSASEQKDAETNAGTTSGTISGCRFSDSRGYATVKSWADGGHLLDNLVTDYATSHYTNDPTQGRWSDGIQIESNGTEVANNEVVDATDVGIIAFRGQNNTIHNNYIINAGNPSFAALAADPLSPDTFPPPVSFDGTSIYSNQIWTSDTAHHHIMIAVGTRAWFGTNGNLGTGVSVTANSNPPGTIDRASWGIDVDGMTNAYVQSNSLGVALSTRWAQRLCSGQTFTPAEVAYDSGDTAGTSIQGPLTNMPLHYGTCSAIYATYEGNSIDPY